MVSIEKMLTKNMCSVDHKWLKTLDSGMNYNYRGMKCKSKRTKCLSDKFLFKDGNPVTGDWNSKIQPIHFQMITIGRSFEFDDFINVHHPTAMTFQHDIR